MNTTSFLQQLPFGKGRAIGANSGKLVDAIIGGWQVSGIISIRSGTSYHVLSGSDTGQTGNSIASSTERANIVSNPFLPGLFRTGITGSIRTRSPCRHSARWAT